MPNVSVSAAMRMSYGQSEWSNKCCGVFCVCEHNDAVCSPIRIILFDDVIFMCFRTQLRPTVSNQIHKPLMLVMQSAQCYTVVANQCVTAIIIFCVSKHS